MSFPIKPLYLLADSRLLFQSGETGSILDSVKDLIEAETPKAAYIGASNGDNPDYFSIFEAAMDTIGIKERRMVYASYGDEDEAWLKQADLILLAGGEIDVGWEAIKETGMQQEIIQRYYGGAVIMGISAGAVQLGLQGWKGEEPGDDDYFETFKLIPFIVDVHEEASQWQRLARMMAGADSYTRGIAIPSGGGMIYHVDHTLEPVAQPLVEFSLREETLHQTLLFPPREGEDLETATPAADLSESS